MGNRISGQKRTERQMLQLPRLREKDKGAIKDMQPVEKRNCWIPGRTGEY